MLGFSLARLPYLNIGRDFRQGASPGEYYWMRSTHRIGMILHLACVLPAGILMVLQFIPAIRYRAILLHRINGHVVILLILLSNVGALMIARRAFGGDLSTQAAVGVLVIATTTGMFLAYYNIRMLQIDQHRAWMLRTMVLMGTIITTRLIMIISAQVVSAIGSYNVVMNCGELDSILDRFDLAEMYPSCLDKSTLWKNVLQVVHVKFGDRREEIGASLRVGFGMALWLSIFLHGVGVEIYLSLTPREAQRLRSVSYERQMEAGMDNPGSAGLVIEKFGDSEEWRKPSK
jgi:hypothetical protein